MATYWVDPDATDDTGDGSKSNPWKTTNHVVSPGDIIRIKKSSQTAMGWTVSGTYGQRDLIASSDPSSDIFANDVILVDGEYYIVRGVSGTTIQTFKPFLGSTGGSKTCYKMGVFDIGTATWEVYSNGNSSGNVLYLGGCDWSTGVQDGYTFIKGSSTYVFKIDSKEYFSVRRICPVYTSSSYGYPFYAYGLACCDIEHIVTGSSDHYGLYISMLSNDTDMYLNAIDVQGYYTMITGRDSRIRYLDIWLYGSNYVDLRANNEDRLSFEHVRINGSEHPFYSLIVGGNRCFFADLKLGEVLSNTVNSVKIYSESSLIRCFNSNIDLSNVYLDNACNSKIISLNHNGASGDNRTGIYGLYTSNCRNGIIQSDTTLYKTTSPSLKFTPLDSIYPVTQLFQVPVESGEKKIIIYLRKNSSYNGSYCPKIFVRYVGTDSIWKEDSNEMSDINDSWEEVSVTINTSVDQVVEVEVRGLGTSGNFWCDDISVEEAGGGGF